MSAQFDAGFGILAQDTRFADPFCAWHWSVTGTIANHGSRTIARDISFIGNSERCQAMLDAKGLLDRVLGGQSGGPNMGPSLGGLGTGALAGGLAAILLGTKTGRKLGGSALKLGGIAAVGAAAAPTQGA